MTSPATPSLPPSVPPQVQTHDVAAFALEAALIAATAGALAAGISAPIVAAQGLWRRLFGDVTTRQRGPVFARIVRSLSQDLARSRIDASDVLMSYARQARALGIQQGFTEADRPVVDVPVTVGWEIRAYIDAASRDADERVSRTARILNSTQSGTWRTVEHLANTAHQAATGLAAAVVTVFNTELNAGITDAANTVGAQRLWIAEADACVHCLALSGTVVDVGQPFPMEATFGAKPLTWEPISAGGLTGPPRHPRCRCRVSPWLGHAGPGIDLPTALRREAERSILNGNARPTESPRIRLSAAERLLSVIGDAKHSRSPSGWPVPATVKQRAHRATKRGQFSPLAPRRGTPKE